MEIGRRLILTELLLMATSGNTLFDQTYKKQLRERKNDWTFKVKIQVTKSAILLNFCKAARPQMFLILSI